MKLTIPAEIRSQVEAAHAAKVANIREQVTRSYRESKRQQRRANLLTVVEHEVEYAGESLFDTLRKFYNGQEV